MSSEWEAKDTRPLPVAAWLSQPRARWEVVQLAPCKCDCALPSQRWTVVACGLGLATRQPLVGPWMMGGVVVVVCRRRVCGVCAQMPNYESTG